MRSYRARRAIRLSVNFRYPIFLDVASKKCLVTGDGYETFGKVKSLLDCGAQVVYVNPHAHIAIEALAEMGRIKWVKRDFEATDLNGCFLVITDREDNSEVFRLAEERNILCNSVDDPEHCRFSFGSVLRRGDLAIAISTNGRAPALAVRLKEQLACEIGLEYEELMSELSALRPEISQRIQNFSARRDLWYRIVDSDVLEHLRQGERQSAHQLLRQMLEDAISNISRSDTCGDSGDP